MNATDELLQELSSAYLAAAEAWQGCDSTTTLSPRGLNLVGLKAKQTRLLAEATSGEESRAWAEATSWLERLEQEARDARLAAAVAVEQFGKHNWAAAWERINEACTLESKYHGQLVWGPLRELIAAWADNNCANEMTT